MVVGMTRDHTQALLVDLTDSAGSFLPAIKKLLKFAAQVPNHRISLFCACPALALQASVLRIRGVYPERICHEQRHQYPAACPQG